MEKKGFNKEICCAKYSINPELLEKWIQEQDEVCQNVSLKDTKFWQKNRRAIGEIENDDEAQEQQLNCKTKTISPHQYLSEDGSPFLKYVAGYDISYLKNEDSTACAALIVCELPSLEIIYEDIKIVNITTPYVPGFLCFREALPAIDAMKQLKTLHPELEPQVILIDGNGYLHNRGAGLASYLGVKLGIPTIGVGKNLYFVENIQNDEHHKEELKKLQKVGDNFPLISNDGTVLGMALKTCSDAIKPVYVSVGHQISIETAVWVVQKSSKYRIPEPIRQADIRSRQTLRENFMQE